MPSSHSSTPLTTADQVLNIPEILLFIRAALPMHSYLNLSSQGRKEYMEFLLFFFLMSVSLFSLLPPPCIHADDLPLPGTIDRTTKQQIIATLSAGVPSTSQTFLISPDGKYTAYFLRHATLPGAGGFGNDFCYIQVEDTATSKSMWESECAPVSTSNACSLVFSDSGLEVFDGSNSVWNTGAESAGNNPLQTLELVDEGDMRIRDNGGELAWKASDQPQQNQRCGEPGSPGLAAAQPPFAEPVGGSSRMPFGQQQQPVGQGQVRSDPDNGDEEQHEADGVGKGASFGFRGQPLVDSTPYDSGSCKGVEAWVGLGSSMLLGLLAFGGILF